MKCLLTHKTCTASHAGIFDNGDSCQIRRYKNSDRMQDNGRLLFDNTCRFYGITRAEGLQRIFHDPIESMKE